MEFLSTEFYYFLAFLTISICSRHIYLYLNTKKDDTGFRGMKARIEKLENEVKKGIKHSQNFIDKLK